MPTGGEPSGWLILSRKLFASDLWARKGEPFCRRAALVDLLQLAAHSGHVQRIQDRDFHVAPGELLSSSRWLGKRWGWSRSKAQRYLLELRKRGTLTMRPAWLAADTVTVPPTVYSFPKYLEHQRRRESGGVSQGEPPPQLTISTMRESGAVSQGKKRASLAQSGVSQGSESGGLSQGRGLSPLTIPLPSESGGLSQGGEPGNPKCEPGDTPGNTGENTTPWVRGKKKVVIRKNNIREISLCTSFGVFPELDQLNGQGEPFHIVAALADVADRFGRHPRHRGLNVRLLLEHIERGADPVHIAHAIRGLRHFVDAGELEPWLTPGDPFTVAALFSPKAGYLDQPLFAAAVEVSPTLDHVSYDSSKSAL